MDAPQEGSKAVAAPEPPSDEELLRWVVRDRDLVVAQSLAAIERSPPSMDAILARGHDELLKVWVADLGLSKAAATAKREDRPRFYRALEDCAAAVQRRLRQRERAMADELGPLFVLWAFSHRYGRPDSQMAQDFLDEEALVMSREGLARLLAKWEENREFQADRRWKRLGLDC